MKRTRWMVWVGLGLGVLALAACGASQASETAIQGEAVFTATFDEAAGWEQGTYPVGETDPDSVLAVEDGRYVIEHRAGRSASFTWGVGAEAPENVIVEVEVEQLSAEDDNLFGVLCRLAQDERGEWTGYALLLSGDGHYGIAELTRGTLNFLLEWHQSEAIRQGQATNTLRAVCVDNYLAIYANDTFLGEVRDSMYRHEGQLGLIAGVKADGAVRVSFDDLSVYEGTLGD